MLVKLNAIYDSCLEKQRNKYLHLNSLYFKTCYTMLLKCSKQSLNTVFSCIPYPPHWFKIKPHMQYKPFVINVIYRQSPVKTPDINDNNFVNESLLFLRVKLQLRPTR